MNATVFLSDGRSTLRCRSGSLIVTRADEDRAGSSTLATLDAHSLELVCVVGAARVSGECLLTLLRKGIALAYFSKAGKLRGRLVSPAPRSGDLRSAQHRALAWEILGRTLATESVRAKLAASAEVLAALRSNRTAHSELGDALRDLRERTSRIDLAESLDSLRGLEGAAARSYFAALAALLPKELGFHGRAVRPPRDPVNALLSFGYTLLTERAASALEARGLDPALGYMHTVRAGRPSLALDIIEPLRQCVVDRLVIRALHLRQLRLEHFVDHGAAGVRLTQEGRKRFFQLWSDWVAGEWDAQGRALPQRLASIADELAARIRIAVRVPCAT
jgi:CRISPR-associated protein Cas1